jgi:hypothetical protein
MAKPFLDLGKSMETPHSNFFHRIRGHFSHTCV